MKELIKKVVYTVGSTNLIQHFIYPWRGRAAILCYHRVLPDEKVYNDNNPQRNLAISETLFNEHMEYLVANHKVVSMDELTKHLNSKSEEFVVAVTFDDGYKDNLQNALPILQKFNIPAIIYISTRFPEGDCTMWWYELWELIKGERKISLDWKKEKIRLIIKSYSQKIKAYNKLNRLLVVENFHSQRELMKIIRRNNNPIHYDSICLQWNDIENLSKHHLIAIGSHAHTHCSLRHLKDEQVTWELEYSKKLIEKRINKVVNHLAFPFGTKNHVSKRDHIIARKCGYKTAVQTTVKVLNKAEELYSLPRLSVRNTNSSVINAKLNGVLYW